MRSENSPDRFAFEAKIQASEQRIPAAMRHDPLGSDNDDSVVYAREPRIFRQQTASQRDAITARFIAKVHETDSCWLWTASTRSIDGHGQFTIRDAAGKQHHLYAHRVAWVLAGRVIPPGLKVCHTCDVPRCVRLSHLFLGTQADNLADAIVKGRLPRKLSEDAYRDILTPPYQFGSGIALALKYGVTPDTISRIRRGRQGSTYRTGRYSYEFCY